MKTVTMQLGDSTVDVSVDEKNLLDIIKGNPYNSGKTEDEVITEAIENPIASKRLKDIVNPSDKVCVIISDATRLWQKPSVFLPKVVEEIKRSGVPDENIIFVSATGTHRKQTAEEHELLLGKDLYKRFKVIDHNSLDSDNMVYLGTTSYGTPVKVNKTVMDCDKIVLTGAIVYHLLVGWSGGKKSILPGVSSYETVMANHSLSLSKEFGKGSNPFVRSGNIDNNPVHKDMLEAAAFVKPSFMFNVVMGGNGNIVGAVSGDYVKAHAKGRELVDKIDGVETKAKADLVIGSAGGYPKDINLYQSIKPTINLKTVAKEGGSIILLSECRDGLGGNADIQNIILNYDTVLDREKALREDYSISKYVGYFLCETGSKYDFIIVSDKLDPVLAAKANIKVVKTVDEALKLVYDKKGKDLKTVLMPHAANTLPILPN